MSGQVWIPVTLEIESPLSWRVDFGAGDSTWIPKSQIQDYSEVEYEAGDDIEIEIPEWLALERGMI